MKDACNRYQIAVLAAGFSRRLGRPKALVHVHGRSLLRRTLLIAARLSDLPILVVIPDRNSRYRAEAAGVSARFIQNRERAAGLSRSVHLAVKHSQHAAALLLLPTDLAELAERDLKRLVRGWQPFPHRIVATRFENRGGIPLMLPRRYFRHAANLQGDTGLRELLRALAREDMSLLSLPSAAFDVDTPAQLSAARGRFRGAAVR